MGLNFRLGNFIKGRYRYRYWPTWLLRGIDIGLHIRKSFERYPLRDQVDSLSCQPLFIISAGRSGTTLLRSILVAGKEIAIPPESWHIPLSVRRYLSLRHLGWEDLSRLIIALFESTSHFQLWNTNLYPAYQKVINLPSNERSLSRIIDEVFVCYWQQNFPDAKLWGDKSPINTLNLPRIYELFPKAKYLHMVRDSRDSISSMVAKGLDINLATTRWVNSIKQVVSLQNRLGKNQFLEVRYEDLVTEPVTTVSNSCRFLGLDYEDKMLDFWKAPTTIEHQEYDHHRNISKPIFTDSVGQWKKRLTPQDIQNITMKTKIWLDYFGYPIS